MKPAQFEYFAPQSLQDALNLMAQHGYDAKPLAGGQSLVPAMNFRLANPGILVDLNGLAELAYIRRGGDGTLYIGAMTRHSTMERDPLVAQHAPLLHETMPHIAHGQIRNRGTIGGSLAHADPSAELPSVAVALHARFRLQSQTGERWVAAGDFYQGLFITDLAPEELLVEIAIPPMPARSGYAFDEVARRPGDYAMAGVAAIVILDAAGRCEEARLVFLSVGEGPVSATQAVAALKGKQPSPDLIARAAEIAATDDIDPVADIHASAAYRRQLARVLAQRTLTRAFQRASNR
ncbi:MAG: xanthine dehydrogenase family protein subunit M [Anaerolineae bacterium]|nr:xanthine dehydrogenase family protein subunit M [Anaerolineae bacterium]MCB0256103.1 xanthine dehydrogenase family protein subunit M [Anaerolineae bacterium]